MNYQTYLPHQDLSTFVKCYWSLESPAEANPERQRIVPDGCMEMIFHYGDLYKQYVDGNKHIIQPRCFVFGQIVTPLEIEPTGITGIFSVRFHPDGFLPFATMPISEMENKAVALHDLFGGDVVLLEKSVLQAKNNESRVSIIDEFLLNKLTSPDTINRIAKQSVALILQLNGKLSVDELAEQLNVNRRQLERNFESAIGLSPKQLSKIIKFQATLKQLSTKQFQSLTAIAYDGHYYDQSHFIKDFKEFTGISPKRFYANNLKLSAIFAEFD